MALCLSSIAKADCLALTLAVVAYFEIKVLFVMIF